MCTLSKIIRIFALMKHKIYVASSWRNVYYPDVVAKLREAGHEVYDFRNPPSGDLGFKWGNVDSHFMEWSPEEYRDHHRGWMVCWAREIDDCLYPRETRAGTDV